LRVVFGPVAGANPSGPTVGFVSGRSRPSPTLGERFRTRGVYRFYGRATRKRGREAIWGSAVWWVKARKVYNHFVLQYGGLPSQGRRAAQYRTAMHFMCFRPPSPQRRDNPIEGREVWGYVYTQRLLRIPCLCIFHWFDHVIACTCLPLEAEAQAIWA
jgi:hypothetical protein